MTFALLPGNETPGSKERTGDNVIILADRGNANTNGTRAASIAGERIPTRSYWDDKEGKMRIVPGKLMPDRTGYQVLWNIRDVGRSSSRYTIGHTALHETLHLFGLGDRYRQHWDKNGKRVTTPHSKAWSEDIMGGVKSNISQVHFDNWGNTILELAKIKASSSFVMDSKVDNVDNLQKVEND